MPDDDWVRERLRYRQALIDAAKREVYSDPERSQEMAALAESILGEFTDMSWRAVRTLKRGETDQIEAAIRFLQRRPRRLWSGYEAEYLLRSISKLPTLEPWADRLTEIVVSIAGEHFSREYWVATRLANRLWSDDLQNRLLGMIAEAEESGDAIHVQALRDFVFRAINLQRSAEPDASKRRPFPPRIWHSSGAHRKKLTRTPRHQRGQYVYDDEDEDAEASWEA
jgi:hypothetical protein